MTPPPAIPGIRVLLPAYDALICDLWGVVHNGEAAFAEAVAALEKCRREGRNVVLLTNAPRPARLVEPQMRRLGVPASAYDRLITSGDLTLAAINEGSFGRRFLFIGPSRDLPVPDLIDGEQVERPEEADFLFCTGLYKDDVRAGPRDYDALLAACRRAGLPMLCANPDLTVMVGDRRYHCAGALAERYQNLGGEVHAYGKPYAAAYDACLSFFTNLRGETPARQAVLCIGDSIHTDIRGADAAGMASLLILSGIHADEFRSAEGTPLERNIGKACTQAGVSPVGYMPHLVWK